MTRHRHIKILATLGPATSTPDRIKALVEAGANAFRLNLSHADEATFTKQLNAIRAAEEELGTPIAVLADLQGPKLRVGTMTKDSDGDVPVLKVGQPFTLDMKVDEPGTASRAPLPHQEIFDAIAPDQTILLDDGKLRLRVKSVNKDSAETIVEVGGPLSDRKGVNLPDSLLPIPALTEKDEADLIMALSKDVDWIALSFVQRAEDVINTKKIINGRAKLMAKIEKPAALTDLSAIVEATDGVMVARGDLGVELPVEKVPGAQRRIVITSRIAGKPVVVATQMLESMIKAPVPTRAEVTDIALAVLEGADAVMLSAETAVGDFPIEAVATMNKVGLETEQDPAYRAALDQTGLPQENTSEDAIAAAASQVADTIDAKGIICYTTSGSTALRVARGRSRVHPYAFTPRIETARWLTLVWGLQCVVTEDAHSFADMVSRVSEQAPKNGIAQKGDQVVITAGVPFGTPGATNILRIATVD
ncbi:MAG: pyruvate kinase [Alphaproteobacteria bacterium]